MAAVPSARRAVGVELPDVGSDSEAARRLYERHHARVLRFCRGRLATAEDAEDAAQTTFAHALRALRRGVVPQVEIAWLLKIARNVCLTRWDATRRRGRVEVARDPHVLQELAPARTDPGEDLIELRPALARLTEQQRRAILLREWQGLSYREVAEELGLSQEAVESLLFRARRSLARDLRGERELRSGIDLGSILATLKSLFTGAGAAVKVAAVAAAVAAAGALAGPPLAHRIAPGRPSQPPAPLRAPTMTRAPTHPERLTQPAAGRVRRARATRSDSPPASVGAPSRGSTPPATAPAPASPPTGNAAPDPPTAPPGSAAPATNADAPSQPPAPVPPPPVPAASVPSVPSVPGVDAPSVPSPSLPSVPGVPPLDPPALPATPTVSTPVTPPSLP